MEEHHACSPHMSAPATAADARCPTDDAVMYQGLGATLVTTEERAKDDILAAQLPRPRLGLNCIGGSSSAAIAKALM